MQDINQQLYENKSTPEEFIPVYGVVVTVPTGIYTNGQKEFTCDKTFDEVKEILLKGGSIIAVDNNNSRVNFDRITKNSTSFMCRSSTTYNTARPFTIINNIFNNKCLTCTSSIAICSRQTAPGLTSIGTPVTISGSCVWP